MFHVEHEHFGVYVHVPFCVSKCGYCDFYRVTDFRLVNEYIDAVRREIEQSAVMNASPSTIYVGGGTPSSLKSAGLQKLLNVISECFDFTNLKEFTVECNPDDVTEELAYVLVSNGVNRVSMGAQSLNDEMLRFMGRRHNSQQVRDAISNLRSCGLSNISVDSIFGLPSLPNYDYASDIDDFISLGVPHLSAYALSYESESRFSKMLDDGKLSPLPDDDVASQYDLLTVKLASAGYAHYEISNYAMPGFEAVHNSSYWNHTPYYGFGPAASSFYNATRKTNMHDVCKYSSSLNFESAAETETLSESELFEEVVMLRLRTSNGLELSEVPQKFQSAFKSKCRVEIENGNLEIISNNRVRIPEHRWFVSDSIIRRLV